jgi:hypothetical protein
VTRRKNLPHKATVAAPARKTATSFDPTPDITNWMRRAWAGVSPSEKMPRFQSGCTPQQRAIQRCASKNAIDEDRLANP